MNNIDGEGVYTTVDNVWYLFYYPDWPDDFTGLAIAKGEGRFYIVKDGAIVKAIRHSWPRQLYLSQEAFAILEQMNGFLSAKEVLDSMSQGCEWCKCWQYGWKPECSECGAPMSCVLDLTGFVGRFECTDLYFT
jgi:hypothetical protein